MRIWHQSITDLSRQKNYATTLREQAARVSRPGTMVDVHGVRPGTYPDGLSAGQATVSPWAHYLLNVQIIENVRRAAQEGYDAVAMSCFLDPALEEARSAVDIPVLGICESSLTLGMAFGSRYGMLVLDRHVMPVIESLVRRYGFTDRVAGIVGLDPAVTGLELEGAYADLGPLKDRLLRGVKQLADAGAELIIPAEGILNTLFTHHQVTELGGLPVFDSWAALVCHAELAVTLRARAGLSVAHGPLWTRPDERVVASMRAATAVELS